MLSLIPFPSDTTEYISDKLVHFVFYFISVIMLFLSVRLRSTSTLFKIAAGVFAYSFAIESIQYFLPFRSFSLYDMLANLAGIVVSSVLIFGVSMKHQNK